MSFLLENNGESWPDCTLADLDSAVLDMLADREQFVVLTSRPPVGSLEIRFMQARQWPEGVRVDFSLRLEGKWRMVYAFYKSGGQVLRLFEAFYQRGETPDLSKYELEERIFPD